MRDKFTKSMDAVDGYLGDAAQLALRLNVRKCFTRFKMDDKKRITCIAWAYPQQQLNAMRYSSVIIQDNTFNTTK